VVTVIVALIIVGAFIVLAIVVLVNAIGQTGSYGSGAAERSRQETQRRAQSAERQIHEIGQRTREAIIAEARRRQQQGPS
jgi:cytochrome c-type biogenesis protein CcmH/NrfG